MRLTSNRMHGVSGLALLLFLMGCATEPSLRGPQWYGQTRSVSAQGPQTVDVDFEVATPQRAEELRRTGVRLPQTSQGLGDPRAHRDFVDLRVTAVGFGITAGGYLLYCDGLPLPVLVPESHVDLGLTSAEPLSASIYLNRDAALTAMSPGARHSKYAYYRGAGSALIVPTVFSPASTPRIARTMLEVRQHLSETVQRELKVVLLNLAGARVLQGVFSRVMRVGLEPEFEAPAPRQQVRRPAAPALEPASEPIAPAPAPGPLAPSPALVEALTGRNPTPQVAPSPRLPQDVAVRPAIPGQLSTDRPVSPSPSQNSQLQADIQYLRRLGAENIRVNQQQLTLENTQRVGINRPDLQFDYNHRRYHVEYDTPTSGRGSSHQSRTTSNDPDAEIILLIVP